MLALLAAVCFSISSPATFDDLERAKVSDIAGLVNFRYKTDLQNIGLALKDGVTVRTSESQVSYESFDESKQKDGSGKTFGALNWIVTSQNRVACSMGGKTSDLPGGLSTFLIPEQLVVEFTVGRQVAFGSSPQFVLQGITSVPEEGQTLRKAVATAKLKRGTATLTQWFFPGKWIVKRFSIEIKGDGDSYYCSGKITDLNL